MTADHDAPDLKVVHDAVKEPAHYSRLNPQPKEVLTKWSHQGVPHYACSAIEYLARAGHKDDPVQDLRKAIECIRIEIASYEASNEDGT